MEILNSKPVIATHTTNARGTSGAVKTKTIYITTKAGQAKQLQQKLASGKSIGIIRKLPNQSSRVKNDTNVKPFNVSNVTVIEQTIPNRTGIPEREVLWQTSGNGDGSGTQNATLRSERIEIVNPKPVALKVAEYEAKNLTNDKCQYVFPNYQVQKQQQMLQQQQRQLPATRLPTAPRLIPISPGTKPVEKWSKLKLVPVLSSEMTTTNKFHVDQTNILPKGRAPAKEDLTSNVPQSPRKSLLISNTNNNSSRGHVLARGQPSTKFKFPMSSLFSLDLKNVGPIAVPIKAAQKATLIPPKTEPIEQCGKSRITTLLHRKPPLPSAGLGKRKTSKTWSEEDAPLSALSLQNGLQKALSMTPFSALLDEDVPGEKVTKPTDLPSVKHTPSSLMTDIIRSQKIVDEQLRKVSMSMKDLEATTTTQGKDWGNAECSEKKTTQLYRTTTVSNSHTKYIKNVIGCTRKLIVNRGSNSKHTKTDDKDLIHQFESAESPAIESVANDACLNVESQDETETAEENNKTDAIESDLLKEILKRILPQDVVSPKSDSGEINKTRPRGRNVKIQVWRNNSTGDHCSAAVDSGNRSNHLNRQMNDCYQEMLRKWEKYLGWSPNTMRQFETNNALLHHYTADAYEMISNPELSVWSEIEDFKSVRNIRSPDLYPEDLFRTL